MLNPSYLIKSRHDIYYFRYPLPLEAQGKANRVSISLKTRCPKEALRLSKALEYHSLCLISRLDLERMDHADIMSVFKGHYTEVLERSKARIDKEGQLSKQRVHNITKHLEELDALIEHKCDDELELQGLDIDNPEDSFVHKDLQPIMEKYELDFEPDSKEYGMMKAAYKYARRNYFNDLLTYNSQLMDYSLLDAATGTKPKQVNKPEHKLSSIMNGYLRELAKSNITPRSYQEQKDCLNYLSDCLGEDYFVTQLSAQQVQDIKEKLQSTPTNRNKGKLTRGLSLLEQIAVAKQNELKLFSTTSVNKYLGYFSCLFDWAERNKLVEDNPFKGIRVKNNKKENRRDMFKKDEIALILEELQANKSGKVKNKSQYWGALIAIYTGARRNEISALMVDDVKRDDETGIWYFDIVDEEEEGKSVKTDAARRIVPVHSTLIELGFLDYWEDAKETVKAMPKQRGMEARLLYDFTFTEHDKWGRKLGQFMNERLLPYLDIHVKNKKTLHSLRHSFITFMNIAGVEAETIKSMVGHEQNTVTHSIYTHYGIDHLQQFKEAIERLGY